MGFGVLPWIVARLDSNCFMYLILLNLFDRFVLHGCKQVMQQFCLNMLNSLILNWRYFYFRMTVLFCPLIGNLLSACKVANLDLFIKLHSCNFVLLIYVSLYIFVENLLPVTWVLYGSNVDKHDGQFRNSKHLWRSHVSGKPISFEEYLNLWIYDVSHAVQMLFMDVPRKSIIDRSNLWITGNFLRAL